VSQPDAPSAERRLQIFNAFEEVRSKVQDSIQASDAIQRIQETMKEDISDHLEVINRSDFEVRKDSALISSTNH
jgi:hypothetical protein